MDKLDVIDTETLASMLLVSDRQIRTWVKDAGCPAIKEGRTVTFRWPDVLAWYVDFKYAQKNGVAGDFAPDDPEGDEGENINAANLRKTRAEADLKEMALAKVRGEMILIADARVLLDRLFSNLRQALLNLAPGLSTRLAGEPDQAAIEAAIRETMETFCHDLSTGSIVGGAPELPATDPVTLEIDAAAADALDAMADAFVARVDSAIRDFVGDYAALQS